MSFQNGALTRALAVIVTVTVIATPAFGVPSFDGLVGEESYRVTNYANTLYARTLEAGANKLFRYGLDGNGVPFAQKADGTKGRFVSLSPEHFKLQIAKGRGVGEVEFIRPSEQETLTRFKAHDGDGLLVRTLTQTDNDGVSRTIIGFQYKNEKVTLKIGGEASEKGLAPDAEKHLGVMAAEVRKNLDLKDLMEDARIFADRSVLSVTMSATAYTAVDSLECIIDAGECIYNNRGLHSGSWRFDCGLPWNRRGGVCWCPAPAPGDRGFGRG